MSRIVKPRRLIIFICFTLLVIFLVTLYHVFCHAVVTVDLKRLAEEKVSKIFDARITVDTIRVGLLKYITLSGLKIERKLPDENCYLVAIKNIVFKYSVFSLFKMNFAAPSSIILDAPTIEFNKVNVPYSLFEDTFFQKKGRVNFEVRDGKISYVIPGIKTRFSFTDIVGAIHPESLHAFTVDFTGQGTDDLNGSIAMSGTLNAPERASDLTIHFNDISIASSSFAPIQELKGAVHVKDDEIAINDVSFYIRDIPFIVNGTISHYNTSAQLDLQISADSKYFSSAFVISGDIANLRITGNAVFGQFTYDFTGGINLNEGGFTIVDMIINDVYTAEGSFSLGDGTYTLDFKKGKQNVGFSFSHDKYHITLDINVHHLSFLGYDFVTVGKLELEPALSFWRDGEIVFNGELNTEYMIFNYTPLKDFHATFTLSPEYIKKMQCKWGDVYTVSGEVELRDTHYADIELMVDQLDLADCELLGGVVIPEDIVGTLESRVTIEGPANAPHIEGYVKSGEGHFKAFDFEKVIINFIGDRHLLALKDSKVYHSGNVFYLCGNIDFSKRNIFHDVILESSEKIILWHGWDLSKNVHGDEIELKKTLTDNVDFSLRRAFRSGETDTKPATEGAYSLEYDYAEDQSISISYEDEELDSTVSLRHTISF